VKTDCAAGKLGAGFVAHCYNVALQFGCLLTARPLSICPNGSLEPPKNLVSGGSRSRRLCLKSRNAANKTVLPAGNSERSKRADFEAVLDGAA
jgi:hypothetical protein